MLIIFHVWKSILAEKGIPQSHLCILEKNLLECEDYVRDHVFMINFGTKVIRGSRTMNLITGDGGMKKQNRDFEFDVLMANSPLEADIKKSRIISKYEFVINVYRKYQSNIGRAILFIERNLFFLKDERRAIVLPPGRFNNSSDKYIRDFIGEQGRIFAVVGLNGNVIRPHTGENISYIYTQMG